MLQILNLQEAKEWSEKNLYEADSFLFPLDVAVKRGLLLAIDEEHFAVVETENKETGCVWRLEEIKRLSDEEMKESNLFCRYRFKAYVLHAPKDYKGILDINAGFNL